jgi:hypothetical protein
LASKPDHKAQMASDREKADEIRRKVEEERRREAELQERRRRQEQEKKGEFWDTTDWDRPRPPKKSG